MTPIIQSLSDISERYEVLFCDVWGCLHNGVEHFPAAVAALQAFRASGGAVVLLTNAPRPAAAIKLQLDRLGVPLDVYDCIVTSGDAAREAVRAGDWGTSIYHIGPERDHVFFEGLDMTHASIRKADSLICTGLRNEEKETPKDYIAELTESRDCGLSLLCANPDIVVEKGQALHYCAGALAQAYEEIGGRVVIYGKPNAPIYRYARRELAATIGQHVVDDVILCIGDGIHTDVAGGIGEGLDTLFVTGGLAAKKMGPDPLNPDTKALEAYLNESSLLPTAAIGRLC